MKNTHVNDEMNCIFVNKSYEKKIIAFQRYKRNNGKLINESNLGARLVDLPNIQLFVVVNAFVHLIGFEAFGRATVHNFRDFG